MTFFNRYPDFTENVNEAGTNRLNARWQILIKNNEGLIAGKRILDLGSFNGRWTAAALHLGAKHVIGIEGRLDSIRRAEEMLKRNKFDSSSYRFIHSDITMWLRNATEHFDTILCLGVFYHFHNQTEIFELLKGLEPEHILLDTKVNRDTTGATVKFKTEHTYHELNSSEEMKGGLAWIGIPNNLFIHRLAGMINYSVIDLNWDNVNCPGTTDYQKKDKRTYLLSR